MSLYATEAALGMTGSAAKSAAEPDKAFSFLTSVTRNLSSIPAYPWTAVLRPWFGTQYMNPLTQLFGLGGIYLTCGLSAIFAVTQRGSAIASAPLMTILIYLIVLVLSFWHGRRLWKLMLNMHLEEDSRDGGPSLGFFYLLPGSHNWLILHCIWEPLAAVGIACIVGMLGLVNPIISAYLGLGGICYAIKSFIEWYEAWAMIRNMLDQQHRAPVMQRITQVRQQTPDLNQPQTPVMATIPLDANQRTIIATSVTLSPEVAALLSPLPSA